MITCSDLDMELIGVGKGTMRYETCEQVPRTAL